MPLNSGPVVYLTSGLPPALDGLPAVTQFASTVERTAEVLIRVPARMEASMAEKLLAEVRAKLPEPERIPVQGARPKDLRPVLLDVAESTGGTVAVVPSRRRGLNRLLAGNTFERLLHDGPLPVLALPRSGAMPTIKRVLFPADFSPRSDKLFGEAIEICKRLDAELHLLHVFGPDQLLPHEVDIDGRSAADSARALLQIDQDHLAALRDQAVAQGVRAVVASATGRAHTQILTYAAAESIDLIVMISHGPRSSEDIFRGTTTARVILNASMPVLAAHG